jgi:hypothetical protein
MAGEERTEHSQRRRGHSRIPTTISHAPVATQTLSTVEKRTGKAGLRWFLGLLLSGAAATAAFSALRVAPRNTAPPTALTRPTSPAPTPAAKPALATVSLEASASPGEARLYLDGVALPSNPYIGRIAADNTQHLLRAEAPGYEGSTRAFLANREVAIIMALARTDEPPAVEIKRGHPATGSPPAAPPVAPTKSMADDCAVSPYYVDDRNIKVVKPECLRAP